MAGLALAWLLADDRVDAGRRRPGRARSTSSPVREALEHPLDRGERAQIGGGVR